MQLFLTYHDKYSGSNFIFHCSKARYDMIKKGIGTLCCANVFYGKV